jgi:transcription antitermination factor NusG
MLQENEPHWFVMRIRNSSIARLQTMLERLDKEDDVAETYAPLGFIKVSKTKIDFAPFLLNYIFVRSDFQKLVKVKSNQQLFEPLRFVMHPVSDENFVRHVEPLFLSDKSMHDYMRMTKEENDRIVFLNNMQFASKVSKEVQITEGEFAGVIGRIKRIKGLRCVVLPIGSEMAAAVVDVPNKYLRYLTDEEERKIEEQEKQDRKKINT